MYHYYLPQEWHQQAAEYLKKLSEQAEAAPLFKRLTPYALLPEIAVQRLAGRSCYVIANEFEVSLKVIKRRDMAITQWMALHFPDLYHVWSDLFNSTQQPALIKQQATQFKQWLTDLLNLTQAECVYCRSTNTVWIGQRLTFRCRQCRHTFNQLKPYHLHRLSHHELWPDFIDLLISGETNQTVTRTLGINVSTAAKWRFVFLLLMKEQEFTLLADWIAKQRHQRYSTTYHAVKAGAIFLPRAGSKFKPKWH